MARRIDIDDLQTTGLLGSSLLSSSDGNKVHYNR